MWDGRLAHPTPCHLQKEPLEFNGGNFVSKEEPVLFLLQNAATMSA